MTRLSRFIYYILIIFFFIFILSILPSFQNEKVAKPHPLKPHQGTKYLSWFPHGEFTDQHEAFRNALRLGMEMDRTVIVPKLRLGKSLPWKPFSELAQQYTEHNDKELIREKYCKEAVNEISPITTTATTNTDDSICTTLNEWTEIAWSSLFDLKAISKEYNINIIERLEGHGWGMDESAIEIKNKISDVVIVDAQTFPENITLYDESYVQQQRLKAQIEKLNQKKKWGDLLFNKNQQLFGKSTPSSSPHLPLNNVVRPLQWEAVKNRQYLQFGALSSTPRYQTHQTKKQMAFRKSLNKYLLVSPNQLSDLTKQANKVITTLGGINTFSSLRLNFAKLISLDARINKKLLSSSASNNNNDIMVTTMDDLDPQTQKEVMDAVVLEVFGDIPINQAVSAAMPVNPSSPLADILLKHKEASSTSLSTSPIERQKLLNACLNYRADVEQKYPIYYLFNDYIDSPITRPDIYGPLLSFFPCLFTKEDMKQWGILDMITWIKDNPELNDHGVDYEKLLNPILDILIAGQGYSFFEVPQTPLSRFMGWQRKGSLSDNDSL